MQGKSRLAIAAFFIACFGGCAVYGRWATAEESAADRYLREYQSKVSNFATSLQCTGGCNFWALFLPH